MANPFVHVELMSTDVSKAKSFYGKLLNWELEDMPMADATSAKSGRISGGASTRFAPRRSITNAATSMATKPARNSAP